MSEKTQISIRVSAETRRKLDALAESYGTITEAVAVAVDRLYTITAERGVITVKTRYLYEYHGREEMKKLTPIEQGFAEFVTVAPTECEICEAERERQSRLTKYRASTK